MTDKTKKDIKLIAIDVDGTLLNSKGELTARVEAALRAAQGQGVQVVLATGKTRVSTLSVMAQLNLTTPGIYLQGPVIYDGAGKILQQQTLTPAVLRQVLTYVDGRGFTPLLYSGTRVLARAVNRSVAENFFARYHEPDPEVVGALHNVIDTTPINKMVVVGEPARITALRYQLNLQIGGAGRVVQAGVPEMLELLPPGASKGAALKFVLKELRLTPEQVLAIGDAENDMEMIQLAGVGVAMGQASQRVKDAADHVVSSNDSDGVAEAIERFVLASPEPAGAKDGASA
jgi:Cof subfamily protein (haloacid dehalogenase superfamily)